MRRGNITFLKNFVRFLLICGVLNFDYSFVDSNLSLKCMKKGDSAGNPLFPLAWEKLFAKKFELGRKVEA